MQAQLHPYPCAGKTSHGYLAVPSGDVSRPGIVIFHEGPGAGPHTRRRAEMLAELGYVALAADMYGEGRRAASHEEAFELVKPFMDDADHVRACAQAALDALAAVPGVDARRLAAIGYCVGGYAALELARSGAPLAGAVSLHGVLDTRRPARPGVFQAKVLACTGADDPLIKAQNVVTFQQEMTDAKVDWQVVAYGGVGHAFTDPEVDSLGVPGFAYSASADARSWQAMRGFLEEVLFPSAKESS